MSVNNEKKYAGYITFDFCVAIMESLVIASFVVWLVNMIIIIAADTVTDLKMK